MDSGPSRLEILGGLKAIYYSQRPKGFFYATALTLGFLGSLLPQLIFRKRDGNEFYQVGNISITYTVKYRCILPWIQQAVLQTDIIIMSP